MKEKSSNEIEKAFSNAEEHGHNIKNIDQEMEKISEKDEELYNFVQEKSEGLEPKAKELIKIYTDISRIAQKEFNREDVMEKERLIEKAKTFKDMTDQIFEKLRAYLISIPEDKAKETENFLINLAEESKAIQKDAQGIDSENKEGEQTLNGAIVSVLYRLRDVTEDLYEANLYNEDNPEHNNLPEEIPKKITQIYKNKERKIGS